jgi:MFS superfamily sulfate permease-like transporter
MKYMKSLGNDLPAGIVVFLVALPLCLGIALASGAPLFSGILTGIIGGLLVSMLSGSQLAVSGPAAGLAVIVLNGIEDMGGFEAFLVAVILAGIIQLVLGFLKAGFVALFFPNSVIKGLLAAIGLILILKQIPHFLGVDQDFFGNLAFWQADGYNTFSEIIYSFGHIETGIVLIGAISLSILLLWERPFMKQIKLFKNVPGALIAVVVAVVLKLLFDGTSLEVGSSHLVELPIISSWSEMQQSLSFPDFSILSNPQVYILAISLGLIASVETLLSLEATDKLDPQKRTSSPNRELLAQGVGNIVAGFIGGLPMTAVIVRSSANINSGGKTRMSSFIHGLLLCLSVFFIPELLNHIPLSALAAVLLMVGYKLISVDVVKRQWKLGRDQFIPFAVTVLAIVLTDLLIGIVIGMVVGAYIVLRENYKHAFHKEPVQDAEPSSVRLVLSEQVTFLNKAHIQRELNSLPKGSRVIIDGSQSRFIDHDVLETINEFRQVAGEREVDVQLVKLHHNGEDIQK